MCLDDILPTPTLPVQCETYPPPQPRELKYRDCWISKKMPKTPKTYDHLVNSYLVKLPKRLKQELPIPDSFLAYALLGIVLDIVPHDRTDRSAQTKLLVQTKYKQEIWTTNHWLVELSSLSLNQQSRLLAVWNSKTGAKMYTNENRF